MDVEEARSESKSQPSVDCVIAMVWPGGRLEPLCEMFLVDHHAGTWTSKHYSGGEVFVDGGRLRRGETARTLALNGTRSGLFRYVNRAPRVRFVVANLPPRVFEETRPTDWSLDEVERLPGADVETFGVTAH